MITSRDLDIIKLLDSNGVATSKQISSIFFNSHKSGQNRITYLVKQGIINKIPVTQYINLNTPDTHSSFSLTDKDCLFVLGNKFTKIRPSAVQKDMVRHNLICNDIFSRVYKLLSPNVIYYSFEKYNKKRISDFAPDITLIGNTFKLAIEVERTLKRSAYRYLKKFTYYSDSDYTHVLYVCHSNEINNTITKFINLFNFIGSTILTFEKDILSHNLQLTQFINTKYK